MVSSAAQAQGQPSAYAPLSATTVSMAFANAYVNMPPAPYPRCIISISVRPHATALIPQSFAWLYRAFIEECTDVLFISNSSYCICSRPAIRFVMAAYPQPYTRMNYVSVCPASAGDRCPAHKALHNSHHFCTTLQQMFFHFILSQLCTGL